MKVEIVERTSKSGSKYTCLAVELVPGYVKYVFLDKAEVQLIKLIYSRDVK